MKVSTREELLRIWSATVDYSYRDGKWVWGGRDGSSSIADAEQLLTVLYPASLIPSMRLDRPDLHSAGDVVDALAELGGPFDIPHRLLEALVDFHERYQDSVGAPVFSGGSYLRTSPGASDPPSLAQEDLDLVDSMSMSLTLCLAALGMARTVKQASGRATVTATCERLEELASRRLTAAMVGLLRSFSVHTFEMRSPAAEALARLVNQTGQSDRRVLESVFDDLSELRASLRRELTIGTGQVAEELEDPTRLFECGWSWGIIEDAPLVEVGVEVGTRPAVAIDRPHVYFSVVALEGIQDLFSSRTRRLGLLDEEQQRLAAALQLRWDWTRDYWSTLATFGEGQWPLEDVPWATLEGEASEYHTLLISSLLMAGAEPRLANRNWRERLGAVLDELANRGRITRRPTPGDIHLALHEPGLRIPLHGSEVAGTQRLEWEVSNFASMLFKRVLDLASREDTVPARRQAQRLADDIWSHLRQRQLKLREVPGARLWDQPAGAFPQLATVHAGPSWYHTQKVVEGLVVAASLTDGDPVPNTELAALAEGLATEAEHLLDQFRLSGLAATGQMPTMLAGAIANLQRSRDILPRRPGSAYVLATDALRTLDEVAAAHDQRQ